MYRWNVAPLVTRGVGVGEVAINKNCFEVEESQQTASPSSNNPPLHRHLCRFLPNLLCLPRVFTVTSKEQSRLTSYLHTLLIEQVVRTHTHTRSLIFQKYENVPSYITWTHKSTNAHTARARRLDEAITAAIEQLYRSTAREARLKNIQLSVFVCVCAHCKY